MKNIIFLLFFIVSFLNSNAQSYFDEGYIVTLEGDTVRGLIYTGAVYNFCRFKKTESDTKVSTYAPYEIKGFGIINDKCFVSKVITGKVNNKVEYFLECLITGPTSLYKTNNTYYIETADTIISLAVEQKIIERDHGGKSTMFMKKYVGILRYLFMDCEDLSSKIDKIKLTDKSLTKIVKEYNNCKYSPFDNDKSYIEYKTIKPWIKADFGVIGGMVYYKLEDLSDYNPHLNNPDIGGMPVSTLTYTFGPQLYLSWPRRFPRFSLVTGCYYLPANFKTNYSYERDDIKYYNDVTINNKILKFPVGARWIFPGGKISPTLSTGLSFSKYIDQSYKAIIETEDINNIIITRELDLEFHDPKTGIWLGVGINTSLSDKLQGFVELRGEVDNINSSYNSYNEIQIYLIVGVRFIKAN